MAVVGRVVQKKQNLKIGYKLIIVDSWKVHRFYSIIPLFWCVFRYSIKNFKYFNTLVQVLKFSTLPTTVSSPYQPDSLGYVPSPWRHSGWGDLQDNHWQTFLGLCGMSSFSSSYQQYFLFLLLPSHSIYMVHFFPLPMLSDQLLTCSRLDFSRKQF